MPVLLIAIGVGGMLGAYLRYLLAGWVYGRTGTEFPWGTLTVNVSGSFALGVLLPLLELNGSPLELRGFVTVGVLGAFTTFSTFAVETLRLLQDGQRLRAALYVTASLGLGLAVIWLGFALGRTLF
jgi:fluoride exporter